MNSVKTHFRRFDHGIVSLRGLEVVARLKIQADEREVSGEEGAGELADRPVEGLDVLVVALAGDLDAVFGTGEFVLETEEAFVRLQFGIVFRDGEQAAESGGQGGVGFGFLLHGRGSGESAAGVGDVGEDFFLVGGVALHGGDQVRDQVVAALEVRVDVRPCLVHVFIQGDQRVALPDDVAAAEKHDHCQDADKEHELFHCEVSFLDSNSLVKVLIGSMSLLLYSSFIFTNK